MRQMKQLKRIFIVIAFLMPSMINTGASAASEMPDISEDGLQVPGFEKEREWVWNYNLYDDPRDTEPYMTFSGSFKEEKEFAGRRYLEFAYECPDGMTLPSAYLREESGRVYRYFEQNAAHGIPSGEVLLFDYNLSPGVKFNTAVADYAMSAPWEKKELEVTNCETVDIGVARRIIGITGITGIEDVYTVEGFGPLSYGTLGGLHYPVYKAGEPYYGPYYVIMLDDIRDGEGNLVVSGKTIYDSLMTVEVVKQMSRSDGNVYDLQGHRIEAPVPGQPYIRGGRVYIMRR